MNLIKICVWTCDMTSRSYFDKMNSTLGSVVPLAMFVKASQKASFLWGLCGTLGGVPGNSRSRPFPRMKDSDSHSRIMGMDFFIPFPFPNCGNVFFHSLPVLELWVWIIFIPFTLPHLPFHRREPWRESKYCKRYQTSNIFRFLYISYNNLYWGGKLSLGE